MHPRLRESVAVGTFCGAYNLRITGDINYNMAVADNKPEPPVVRNGTASLKDREQPWF